MSAKVHDFRASRWGHEATMWKTEDKGYTETMVGHGYGISAGDIICRSHANGLSPYLVKSIRYCDDPKDMFWAEVEFAPGSVDNSSSTLSLTGIGI